MQHMILMSKKMTSQNKLYEIKFVPYNKTHLEPTSCWINHSEAHEILEPSLPLRV